MKRFRVLLLILFFYDIARFIVMVGMMTQLGKFSLTDSMYPVLAFASAQALFPIMTWFLSIDAENHLAYLPLSIAGKIINIVLSGIWAFFAVSQLSAAISYQIFICLGLTLVIVCTDIVSIAGMVFVKKGFRKNDSDINPKIDHAIGGMECE
jgi:hypothetical protein